MSEKKMTEQEKPEVGTIVESRMPDFLIATKPAKSGGYLTKIKEFRGKWYATIYEPDLIESSLICFLNRVPKKGEIIRITFVGQSFVKGEVLNKE